MQGFVNANLAVTHMFTFRSKPEDGADAMLRLAHQEARRAITKAQRECVVERSMDLDRFIRLHQQSYGPARSTTPRCEGCSMRRRRGLRQRSCLSVSAAKKTRRR
jgi:hypothetical protein